MMILAKPQTVVAVCSRFKLFRILKIRVPYISYIPYMSSLHYFLNWAST